MDHYTALLAHNLAAGATLEEVLALLRANGATPADVIKAIRINQGVSLGRAKQIFGQSPAWAREVLAGDVLHEDVISSLPEGKGF